MKMENTRIKVNIEKVINIGNFNSERVSLGIETDCNGTQEKILHFMNKLHMELDNLGETIKEDILKG